MDTNKMLDLFRKDQIVEVLHMGEGDETFITAVSGRITVERLQDIEKQMADGEAFDKGAGSYVFDCSYFPGQYGEFGYCELPPCWELTHIGFVSLEQLALETAVEGDE
ncbi:hypothetical protein [Pseudomonas sp.]|uniref:hypothetical protein n=1 Tax=Pseudomonas sp. TaxID=306 RepID=UPI0028AF5508|nr:hypothetical protein [Pseudomonas sp.]